MTFEMKIAVAADRPGVPVPGQSSAASRLHIVATVGAMLAAAIGATALIGWAVDLPTLTRVYAAGSAMQPITALTAILAAMGILLANHRARFVGATRSIAALVLAIVLQTLLQHWTGHDLGTDHLLFGAAVDRQPATYAHPGRMAEPTAFAFLLIAIALLSLRSPSRAAGRVLSACATTVLLLVTVTLLSHLYGVAPLTGVLGFTQMSIPTACGLGGLSVAALALRPGGGWVSLLIGRSIAASAARWLLPVVVVVPVVVAALALRGSEIGLYPADFRIAFTTAVTVVLLAALALWGTRQLDGFVSEREAAEALRESEATLRAFFDTEGLFASIIERREPSFRYENANAALARLLGRADLIGVDVRDAWPTSASEALIEQIAMVERGGRPSSMEMALETASGTRWFMVTISPIAGSPAERPRYATASLDITDRKRAEARQRLMLDELNHRVKNTLAVVQSLAQQSFRGDQATPEARQAFESRLAAVAAAHHLLVTQDWTSVSLPALVADVAGPGCGADRGRIEIHGPDILLPPPIAVSLALALHELCTNAVKYGALSNDTGRVAIRWAADASAPGTLHIVWMERDGPPVTLPSRRGFGSKLIERALSADLGGPVQLDFAPEGLTCTITAIVPTESAL
ncbi:MAG: PAS domain-containing protein [Sphingomonas phyllosphaerae]|uniref:sensor histidine kinase n=1 Tax=Sphingomonas phyllosphaerae TaxID=257003 RepID=UPI002FF93DFE